MKKEVKKSFLGALLVSSMFLAMNNVDALTIKETIDAEDATLDKIAEGSIIMGSTKFEPNVVLTALRASKATYNDVMLNKNNPSYKGVNIYYYLSGSWYTVDDANTVLPVDNKEVLENLKESDIYYINNQEKTLEVNYVKDLKEGYELVFETENEARNKDVLYKDGIIYVPATVKNVDIFVKNVKEDTKEKLDSFSRENTTDNDFKVATSQGKVEKGDTASEDLTHNIDGNKITISGNVKWYGIGNKFQDEKQAGNYASVKITAPGIYSYDELKAKAKVAIDGNKAVNWDDVIKSVDNKDTSFVYNARFDSKTTTHTIEITWVDGNTQTFTIELDEKATLALPPQGSIEKGDSTGGELDYTTVDNKITINGKKEIKWYGADANAQNGRPAGNYASVKIVAPKEYTKELLEKNATVKIDDREIVKWSNVIDPSLNEDTFFVYYPRFDSKTTTHTVIITWEDGNTQTFTIELDKEAKLEKAPSVTLEKGDSTGGDLKYTFGETNVTIDGNLLWYKSGPNQNGRKAGNYASVKIVAPKEYTKEFLEKNATVKIDDREVVKWSVVTDKTLNEDTFFVYYPRFDSKTNTHTVIITWEEGNTQTITISLDEKATLQSPLAGTITLDETNNTNIKSEFKDDTLTLDGTINYVKNKGNIFGYTIKAPVKSEESEGYSKEELEKAKITIFNHGKNGQKTTVIEKTGKEVFGENDYFTVTNAATSNFDYDEIIIEWEDGNTQIIKVKFADTLVLEEKPVFVEKIELNETSANIVKGDKLTLEATITPENATNKKVTWKSEKEEIATVDENGVVTAIAYGKTKIIATTEDGTFTAECEINVVYPEIKTTLVINETTSDVGNIFSRVVNIDFKTTGGAETYTYEFTVVKAGTEEKYENYKYDEKTSSFTLNIDDKKASYEIRYVIKDSVGNKIEDKLTIEATEK